MMLMQYERQSEKMEVENLMEQVDSEWKAAHGLLPKAVSLYEGAVWRRCEGVCFSGGWREFQVC